MWHEARRSEKKVHDLMDAAKKRAERRAEFLAKKRGDVRQTLRIVGFKSKIFHDVAMYQAIEDRQSLIAWNGREDNLIDRFDGRSLLDFIREYDSKRQPLRERTEEEEELEERVNFERYRDLVKQRRKGLSDEDGLMEVELELEARHVPLSVPPQLEKQKTSSTSQAGKGSYSQVFFTYEGEGMDRGELEESDEDEEEEEEEISSSEDSEDEKINSIAKEYGVDDFNRLIFIERRAKEEERRQKELALGDPALRKLSRKERRKAARQARERDSLAQYNSFGKHPDPYRERRGSPTYDPYPQRDRSPSPLRRGYKERDRGRDKDRDKEDREKDKDRNKRFEKDERMQTKIEFITEFGGDNVGRIGKDKREESGYTHGFSPSSPRRDKPSWSES